MFNNANSTFNNTLKIFSLIKPEVKISHYAHCAVLFLLWMWSFKLWETGQNKRLFTQTKLIDFNTKKHFSIFDKYTRGTISAYIDNKCGKFAEEGFGKSVESTLQKQFCMFAQFMDKSVTWQKPFGWGRKRWIHFWYFITEEIQDKVKDTWQTSDIWHLTNIWQTSDRKNCWKKWN